MVSSFEKKSSMLFDAVKNNSFDIVCQLKTRLGSLINMIANEINLSNICTASLPLVSIFGFKLADLDR